MKSLYINNIYLKLTIIILISATLFYIPTNVTSASPLKPKSRIFLLGIDGCDPRVIDFLVEEGELPNIAGLIRQGSYGHLATDIGRSPVSWTSIATGKSKEKHGIKSHKPYSSQSIKTKRIWDILEERGKRVGVYNWYFTAPAREINGFMYPGSNLVPVGIDTTPYPPTISKMSLMAMQNNENFIKLINDCNCDFVASLWGSVDSIQHRYWDSFWLYTRLKDTDIANLSNFSQVRERADMIFSQYKEHDRGLGEFLRSIDDDDYIIIVSDHGSDIKSGGTRSFQFKLDFLTQLGFKGEEIKYGDTPSASNEQLDVFIRQKHEEIENPIEDGLIIPFFFKYPEVEISLKAEQGVSATSTLEKVERVFNSITWKDGRQIFSLNIKPKGKIIARISEEIKDSMKYCADRELDLNYFRFHVIVGTHARTDQFDPPDGILIMKGPAIKRGYSIQGAHLFDIVPTILYLMDLPVGRDMDGEALKDAITLFRPIRYIESYDQGLKSVEDTGEYEMREEDRTRLKSLGYIQ